jgi:putative Mn2+ efflux pump MntP
LAFGIIGIVTFLMSFASILLAKKVAGPLYKWAGLLAAIIFLCIGIKILLEDIL